MSAQEVFQGLGGGLAGLLGVVVLVLAVWIRSLYERTISRQDEQIKAQTAAINRLSDAVEAQIGRRLKTS